MNKQEIWKNLIRIPKVIIADAVIFLIALFIDGMLAPSQGTGEGHGGPFVSIIVGLILVVVTAIVFGVTIFRILVILIGPKNNEGKPIKRTNPLIPISFTVILSLFIVVPMFQAEVSSFYNDPNHIGFAIPIVSLTVGFVLFVICAAVALISIIRYTKNK